MDNTFVDLIKHIFYLVSKADGKFVNFDRRYSLNFTTFVMFNFFHLLSHDQQD